MIPMPSIDEIARKWSEVTPGRTADYERGVNNPGKDWADETAAAEDIYKSEVIKAANEGRFAKGVRKAGTEKWKEKARTKGVRNWGPGVQEGQSAYAAGYGPIRDAISRLDLPPKRGPLDPTNFRRVEMVAKAAHEAAKSVR